LRSWSRAIRRVSSHLLQPELDLMPPLVNAMKEVPMVAWWGRPLGATGRDRGERAGGELEEGKADGGSGRRTGRCGGDGEDTTAATGKM
jgi:hypothetical protein